MKKLLLFLCVMTYFQASKLSAQTNTQSVSSKIEKVIAFVNSAQITRTAQMNLQAGKTQLVFKDISPAIDKQSIQVQGTGAFTVLSVTPQLNYLQEQTKRREIETIEQQRNQLNRRLTFEQSQLKVFKQEEAMLLKNQEIGGTNAGLKANELREAMDFHRNRLTEILRNQITIDSTIAEIDSTIAKLNNQLVALNQQKNLTTSEILVVVSAETSTQASFEISYLVKNAGWFATYDLRVKDIASPIDLNFKANVFQSSGEDWQNVKLTLSTGDPSQSGVAPTVSPWYLRFGNRNYPTAYQNYGQNGNVTITGSRSSQVSGKVTDMNGQPLIGTAILIKGTTIGTVTDFDGNYNLNLPTNASILVFTYTGYQPVEAGLSGSIINVKMEESLLTLDEVVVVGYAGNASGVRIRGSSSISSIPIETKETYQPTTFSYEIKTPYSIPNDGKTYTVDIKALEIPAKYKYFTAPKFEKDAFLTASITDWRDLNLLDGEVNLFFEGAYLGKSILDLTNANDTLEISLGRDKSVVVERNKMKDFTRRQFIGKDKTEYRAFEIIIRNNKRQAIDIVIQDQFPISTTKEIDVDKIAYEEAILEKDTDILTWKYTIPARALQKMSFRYAVKYPKNQIL